MKKIALLSLMTSSLLLGGGYKIPENSTNALALGSANIAHNKSADAAYYNPANMVFMSKENHMELDLMYIKLNKTNYKSDTSNVNIDAKGEQFFVPSLFYVSDDIDGARFGLSVVTPGGLSKRWDDAPASQKAKEFTLKIIEVNPTVALGIGDNASVAIGLRMIHSEGIVRVVPAPGIASQDMHGNSIDLGYNIALAYKPMKDLELGLTYRSQVDLKVKGDADLLYKPAALDANIATSVVVPLPATLSLALAYTLPTKTTLEFVYERNYWSAYQELNFNYENPKAEAIFGKAIQKDWKDTNVFRLGVTQELDALTLMAGIVYDETPVPEQTFGFELPDSDTLALSFGGRYALSEKLDIGLSALYAMKKSRTIQNDSGIDGKFSNSDILIVSAGMGYKF